MSGNPKTPPRILLDITPAVAEYARRHGAQFDQTTNQWFFYGEVPPELFSFLKEKPRRTRDYSKEETVQCSKCGSIMRLLQNRKTGQEFYGCSSFPRCKATLPLSKLPPIADWPSEIE